MGKGNGKALVAAKAAVGLGYEAGTVTIPLAHIDRDMARNFTRQDAQGMGDLAPLMREIEADGQRVPVEVARKGTGYVLAAGFRRCEAIARLAKAGKRAAEVEARVLTSNDPLTLGLANVRENEDLGRLQVTWLGRSVGYAALLAAGMSKSEIAKSVGRAEDVVRDALRFPDADPRCRAAAVAEATGKPVKVDAPVYRKGAIVTDKEGNAKTEEIEQEAVVWGVLRLVLRKPVAEQHEWLRKVSGLSVKRAAALLNGRDDKPGKGEEADESGETGADDGAGSSGKGEERTSAADDAVDQLRASAADALVPALLALTAAQEGVQLALGKDDVDAASAANVKLVNALRALTKAIGGVCGKAHVDRVRASLK